MNQAVQLRLRVGSEWGEIAEVITATGGGKVVAEGDVCELASGLLELRNDPDLGRALAQRARSRVEDLFSVDARAEALVETLAAVVGSGQPVGGRDV
ncbi:MAG TPA: hypothetical protein VIZ67_07120 [Acidimicrobiales bacterium]